MDPSGHDVTDAELAVLQALWDQGPCTIRRITEVLYTEGRTAQYATVQKLLERLEGKECVARDRSGSVNIYKATIDRDDLVGRRLQAVAEKLCGGSWTPLLTHLVQTEQLTPKDRQALRQLIDDLDRPQAHKERRGREQT